MVIIEASGLGMSVLVSQALDKWGYQATQCRWGIEDGKIETDLHRKETDRNMYLLPSSCHSPTVTKNIPFSLCLRIVRICSKPEQREEEFTKLNELMMSRGYSERMLSSAIDRVGRVPCQVALRRVLRNKEERRPVFAVTYDPRFPAIQSIQAKHWHSRTLTSMRYLYSHLFGL
jgi:hypothetical protein